MDEQKDPSKDDEFDKDYSEEIFAALDEYQSHACEFYKRRSESCEDEPEAKKPALIECEFIDYGHTDAALIGHLISLSGEERGVDGAFLKHPEDANVDFTVPLIACAKIELSVKQIGRKTKRKDGRKNLLLDIEKPNTLITSSNINGFNEPLLKLKLFKNSFQMEFTNGSHLFFPYKLLAKELWSRPPYATLLIEIEHKHGLQEFETKLKANSEKDKFFQKLSMLTLRGLFSENLLNIFAEIFKTYDGELRRLTLANFKLNHSIVGCHCIKQFILAIPRNVNYVSLDLRGTHYQGLQNIIKSLELRSEALKYFKLAVDKGPNRDYFDECTKQLLKLVRKGGSAEILIEKPSRQLYLYFDNPFWTKASQHQGHHNTLDDTNYGFYNIFFHRNIAFLLKEIGK